MENGKRYVVGDKLLKGDNRERRVGGRMREKEVGK